MPFKIVKTIERGKPQLSIVPSCWEKKGLLRWPPKKCPINKLVTNENSIPQADWLTIKCDLKRTSILSYSRAEEEIDMMAQYSDTTDVDDDGMINTNNITNYNNMAANLMYQNNETPGSSSFGAESVSGKSSNDPVIQKINEEGKILATSVNTIDKLPVNTEQLIDIDKLFSNQKQILDNQVTIMQNQSLLHESQKEIANQEKINFQQLQNLSVQLDYYFTRFKSQSSNVTPLIEVNPAENTRFILKPISNVRELQEFDEKLSDKAQYKELKQQFSLLCSKHEGSGTKCAYKLLDIIFDKKFLCQFSWSGGSRKTDVVKIALKGYKRILLFFSEMINHWDHLFTEDAVEDFFKTVLKNSVKRLENKNLRAATKRKREKQGIVHNKKSKTATETIGNDNANKAVENPKKPNEENNQNTFGNDNANKAVDDPKEPNENNQNTAKNSHEDLQIINDEGCVEVEKGESHDLLKKDIAINPVVTGKETESTNNTKKDDYSNK